MRFTYRKLRKPDADIDESLRRMFYSNYEKYEKNHQKLNFGKVVSRAFG